MRGISSLTPENSRPRSHSSVTAAISGNLSSRIVVPPCCLARGRFHARIPPAKRLRIVPDSAGRSIFAGFVEPAWVPIFDRFEKGFIKTYQWREYCDRATASVKQKNGEI